MVLPMPGKSSINKCPLAIKHVSANLTYCCLPINIWQDCCVAIGNLLCSMR
jgi:hypothetical protein